MENNNIKWYAMSDQGFLEIIGNFIRETRLSQNKTQAQLATGAGINRSTLSVVENGGGGTLLTFISLLRALQKLDFFEQLIIKKSLSPLQLAKIEESGRQRASKKNNNTNNSDW